MNELELEEYGWAKHIRTVSFVAIIPTIMVVGIVVNSICLYILHRPRITGQPAMAYLKALLSIDLVGLVIYICGCVTIDGCEIHSYYVVLYFLHTFYTAFFILNVFGHYIIVWLCYDRFLALWFFHRFQATQSPKVVRGRLIFSGILSILLYLKHLVDAHVDCVRMGGEVVTNITSTSDACENGSWLLQDSYSQIQSVDPWYNVAVGAYLLLGMVVPVVLVVVFNSALVVGVIRRRIQSTATTSRGRDQAYSTIYLTVALSLYRVLAVTVIVSFVVLHSRNTTHCYNLQIQKLRLAVHYFLVFERTINIFFLSINQIFREELKIFLHTAKSCLGAALCCKEHINSRVYPDMRDSQIVLDAYSKNRQSRPVSSYVVSTIDKAPHRNGQLSSGVAFPANNTHH